MISASEESPLLKNEAAPSPLQPMQVLGELIGARHLPITEKGIEPYCIVQFGSKTLHRTKPLFDKNANSSQDPIWTVKECSLFVVTISPNDIQNSKSLVITLWGRQSPGKLKIKKKRHIGSILGKIRIKASPLLKLCTEERVELNLVDELGRKVPGTAQQHQNPTLAVRFRVASAADIRFVNSWNRATELPGMVIPRSVLTGTGVIPHEHHARACIVTELEEWQVPGANLGIAMAATVKSSVQMSGRKGKVRVKPCADPDGPALSSLYMAPSDIKEATKLPSRQWIQAGSGNLGRLYLEILSCHNLPNVDYGNAVGNETDAFCCAVYGDALAETSVINDELSPHVSSILLTPAANNGMYTHRITFASGCRGLNVPSAFPPCIRLKFSIWPYLATREVHCSIMHRLDELKSTQEIFKETRNTICNTTSPRPPM
jgi:hypothetical protein